MKESRSHSKKSAKPSGPHPMEALRLLRKLSPAGMAAAAFLPGAVVWICRVSQGHGGWRSVLAGLVSMAVFAWMFRLFRPKSPWAAGLPVLWLAVSAMALRLWAPVSSAWVPWVLFMALSILTTRIRDGRYVLALWVPVWAAASCSMPGVWVAALFCALFPPPVLNGMKWIRAGAALASLSLGVLAVVSGSGTDVTVPGWVVLMDLLGPGKGLSFALLLWLGAGYSRTDDPFRWWAGQTAGWILAWCGAGGLSGSWFGNDSAIALLLVGAGFGLETLRNDLLDRSWHATLLWAVLGVVCGAVV